MLLLVRLLQFLAVGGGAVGLLWTIETRRDADVAAHVSNGRSRRLWEFNAGRCSDRQNIWNHNHSSGRRKVVWNVSYNINTVLAPLGTTAIKMMLYHQVISAFGSGPNGGRQ